MYALTGKILRLNMTDKSFVIEDNKYAKDYLGGLALGTRIMYDEVPAGTNPTDDASKIGAPTGFKITVREVKVNAGAGFLVAKTGNIMTMPGLPKVPAAERIDIDENGKISGLF